VPERRIGRKASRTAAMTCLSRAASSLERNPCYRSGDHVAERLLPGPIRALIHVPLFRRFLVRQLAPAGVYEYVIARTKYVDAVFKSALAEGFEQVLLFGAGYDTRALRFRAEAQRTRVFELDAQRTQEAKLGQFKRRNLEVPPNVVFVPADLDEDPVSDRLDQAGFRRGRKSLFILEGLVMYLEPESVRRTLQLVGRYAGEGSRLVFDYVRSSVLRRENTLYGEAQLVRSVSRAGERWRFGLEPGDVAPFVASFGFTATDHRCARELEASYFTDADGRPAGRVNGTHCIVTAARRCAPGTPPAIAPPALPSRHVHGGSNRR